MTNWLVLFLAVGVVVNADLTGHGPLGLPAGPYTEPRPYGPLIASGGHSLQNQQHQIQAGAYTSGVYDSRIQHYQPSISRNINSYGSGFYGAGYDQNVGKNYFHLGSTGNTQIGSPLLNQQNRASVQHDSRIQQYQPTISRSINSYGSGFYGAGYGQQLGKNYFQLGTTGGPQIGSALLNQQNRGVYGSKIQQYQPSINRNYNSYGSGFYGAGHSQQRGKNFFHLGTTGGPQIGSAVLNQQNRGAYGAKIQQYQPSISRSINSYGSGFYGAGYGQQLGKNYFHLGTSGSPRIESALLNQQNKVGVRQGSIIQQYQPSISRGINSYNSGTYGAGYGQNVGKNYFNLGSTGGAQIRSTLLNQQNIVGVYGSKIQHYQPSISTGINNYGSGVYGAGYGQQLGKNYFHLGGTGGPQIGSALLNQQNRGVYGSKIQQYQPSINRNYNSYGSGFYGAGYSQQLGKNYFRLGTTGGPQIGSALLNQQNRVGVRQGSIIEQHQPSISRGINSYSSGIYGAGYGQNVGKNYFNLGSTGGAKIRSTLLNQQNSVGAYGSRIHRYQPSISTGINSYGSGVYGAGYGEQVGKNFFHLGTTGGPQIGSALLNQQNRGAYGAKTQQYQRSISRSINNYGSGFYGAGYGQNVGKNYFNLGSTGGAQIRSTLLNQQNRGAYGAKTQQYQPSISRSINNYGSGFYGAGYGQQLGKNYFQLGAAGSPQIGSAISTGINSGFEKYNTVIQHTIPSRLNNGIIPPQFNSYRPNYGFKLSGPTRFGTNSLNRYGTAYGTQNTLSQAPSPKFYGTSPVNDFRNYMNVYGTSYGSQTKQGAYGFNRGIQSIPSGGISGFTSYETKTRYAPQINLGSTNSNLRGLMNIYGTGYGSSFRLAQIAPQAPATPVIFDRATQPQYNAFLAQSKINQPSRPIYSTPHPTYNGLLQNTHTATFQSGPQVQKGPISMYNNANGLGTGFSIYGTSYNPMTPQLFPNVGYGSPIPSNINRAYGGTKSFSSHNNQLGSFAGLNGLARSGIYRGYTNTIPDSGYGSYSGSRIGSIHKGYNIPGPSSYGGIGGSAQPGIYTRLGGIASHKSTRLGGYAGYGITRPGGFGSSGSLALSRKYGVYSNTRSGGYGGYGNIIPGGFEDAGNLALSGNYATHSSTGPSTYGGYSSTIPGGYSNTITGGYGGYSIARPGALSRNYGSYSSSGPSTYGGYSSTIPSGYGGYSNTITGGYGGYNIPRPGRLGGSNNLALSRNYGSYSNTRPSSYGSHSGSGIYGISSGNPSGGYGSYGATLPINTYGSYLNTGAFGISGRYGKLPLSDTYNSYTHGNRLGDCNDVGSIERSGSLENHWGGYGGHDKTQPSHIYGNGYGSYQNPSAPGY